MIKKLKSNPKLQIILIYCLFATIGTLLFYLITPSILSYAPGTINTEFDKYFSNGLYYWQQILITYILLISFIILVLSMFLKDINKYTYYKEEFLKTKNAVMQNNLSRIKKLCFHLPNHILLIFTAGVVSFFFIGLFLLHGNFTIYDLKVILIIYILSSTVLLIANIYVRKVLSKILIDLENTNFGNARKISISFNLIFQTLMICMVSTFFTYLLITDLYENQSESSFFYYYNNEFTSVIDNTVPKNVDDLKNALNNVSLFSDDNVLFITDSDFDIIYQSGELSQFFIKYTKELSYKYDYKIYDYFNSPGRGFLHPVLVDGSQYYVGVYFSTYSYNSISFLTVLFLTLMVICCFILYNFFKEIHHNIKNISTSLKMIFGKINKKLYVTTSDEFSDLIIAYNKIQEQNTKYLNQIKNDQEILIESERLVSLGQLIGGIAHNLKTPIMSISGASEELKYLVQEYDSSIEDPDVNANDHHDIANDMNNWLEKIKNYTEYMSDIITTVKDQTVTFSEINSKSFDLDELVKRVNILMRHELKNAIVYLVVMMKVSGKTVLHGDINNLIQVINNMISNSIQAYNGKPEQKIELIFEKNNDNLIISVRDYASGLPKIVQNKLFHEMITTKGKNGTGLGLYMSYSTIQAHFNGNITYTTEENVGTTFNIILPLN